MGEVGGHSLGYVLGDSLISGFKLLECLVESNRHPHNLKVTIRNRHKHRRSYIVSYLEEMTHIPVDIVSSPKAM